MTNKELTDATTPHVLSQRVLKLVYRLSNFWELHSDNLGFYIYLVHAFICNKSDGLLFFFANNLLYV